VAMTDCELTVIKRSDFQTFVQGEPKMALKLIELLATQLSLANLRFDEVVSLTLPMRIARTLLRLTDESSSGGDSLRFKQYELAEIVRTTRESINKCLRSWAKRKWIRIERGGIALINLSALVAIAGGGQDGSKGPRWRRAGRRLQWR
jgi:CRP/FNR family cyclic AMP-dependent transcriptional regulator